LTTERAGIEEAIPASAVAGSRYDGLLAKRSQTI
jgi:hypothetical protein